MLEAVAKILKEYPEDIVFEQEYEEYQEVEIDREPFTIEVFDDNYYVVTGTQVLKKMIGYTNIDTEKDLAFFQKIFERKKAL